MFFSNLVDRFKQFIICISFDLFNDRFLTFILIRARFLVRRIPIYTSQIKETGFLQFIDYMIEDLVAYIGSSETADIVLRPCRIIGDRFGETDPEKPAQSDIRLDISAGLADRMVSQDDIEHIDLEENDRVDTVATFGGVTVFDDIVDKRPIDRMIEFSDKMIFGNDLIISEKDEFIRNSRAFLHSHNGKTSRDVRIIYKYYTIHRIYNQYNGYKMMHKIKRKDC